MSAHELPDHAEACARTPNELPQHERERLTHELDRLNDPDERSREARLMQLAQHIPADLRAQRQWVLWRYELDEHGKRKKPPYSPLTYRPRQAHIDDPATWASFEQTTARYMRGSYAGVGFVLHGAGALTAIDLDHCRDPQTGELDPWAREIVTEAATYTELSPSSTGLHLFLHGSMPGAGNKRGRFEAYSTRRYLTMTGDQLPGSPKEVRHGEGAADALTRIHRRIFTTPDARTSQQSQPQHEQRTAIARTDRQIIERASNARNGAKFTALWSGEQSDDPSRADLALAAMLLYWTNGDTVQADRLFRQSGLMREKWNERHSTDGTTYGELTLARARAQLKSF